MLRKVFKTGNSLVISLPEDALEALGLADGMDVSVELDRKNQQILIRPARGDLSEEFARQANEFIEEYRPVLEALAHK
jgi:antitoxin MazE